jgi:hypothetical protein
VGQTHASLSILLSHSLPFRPSSCDIGPGSTFLESSFRRGFTIQQGLEGNATIQEGGPSRQPFRRAWDRVYERIRRLTSARASAPGNNAWLPVASLCLSLSPLDRPYHLSVSIDTLIFAQISTKISRLAGSWLSMLQVQSLILACSAYRGLMSLLNRHCASGRNPASAQDPSLRRSYSCVCVACLADK